MNAASIICDNNKELKFNSFSEELFKLCSYENRKTGVKCGLQNKKLQYVTKSNTGIYHYKKYHVQYMDIKKKYVGLKKNTKNHGLVFH